MITAKYIHEACHDACKECPQFREYEDDDDVIPWGRFDRIPKQGIYKTIMFWKEERLLWGMGYAARLPDDVKKIFNDIDKVIADAIAQYCKGL